MLRPLVFTLVLASGPEMPEPAPPVPPAAPAVPAPAPPQAGPSEAPMLRDELRAAAKARAEEQARLDRQRRDLATERTKLEALAAEIEKARAALRGEPARLEATLQRKASEPQPTQAAPSPVARAEVLDERVAALARTLRGMRPEQAALVAARLEPALAVRVLARMRPADAGAVLGRMEAARAADLLDALARLPREEKP